MNDALNPERCASVASNWLVAQNFLTRTALTENFLRLAFQRDQNLILLYNPTNKVIELQVIFYPGFSIPGNFI